MLFQNTSDRISTIKKVILVATILAGFLALFFPMFSNNVYAATQPPICDLGYNKSCASVATTDANSLADMIINIALWLTGIVTAVTVLYIILGAWFIITGLGGDGPTYEKGLKILKNAVLGLVIAIMAFTIVSFIGTALSDPDNNLIKSIIG